MKHLLRQTTGLSLCLLSSMALASADAANTGTNQLAQNNSQSVKVITDYPDIEHAIRDSSPAAHGGREVLPPLDYTQQLKNESKSDDAGQLDQGNHHRSSQISGEQASGKTQAGN